MARNWIVAGDPTSSGGSVLTGSSFTDIDGQPVARVTDQATCPNHKGAFPIVDGDATIIIDGQPVALHGSSLACGCKVLSAKQMRAFVEPGASAGSGPDRAANARALAAAGAAGAAAGFRTEDDAELDHDECFLLKDRETDEPLDFCRYRIILSDGRTEEGMTDESGYTHRARTAGKEAVAIELEA